MSPDEYFWRPVYASVSRLGRSRRQHHCPLQGEVWDTQQHHANTGRHRILSIVISEHIYILSWYKSIFYLGTHLYVISVHIYILSRYTSIFYLSTYLYFISVHIYILSQYISTYILSWHTSLFYLGTHLYFISVHLYFISAHIYILSQYIFHSQLAYQVLSNARPPDRE